MDALIPTNVKTLLEATGISLDQLVDIINKEGGRDPKTPIIFNERCDGCFKLFFSISQDHYMRLNNGFPIHCPSCRESARKQTKLNYYHKNKK